MDGWMVGWVFGFLLFEPVMARMAFFWIFSIFVEFALDIADRCPIQ